MSCISEVFISTFNRFEPKIIAYRKNEVDFSWSDKKLFGEYFLELINTMNHSGYDKFHIKDNLIVMSNLQIYFSKI